MNQRGNARLYGSLLMLTLITVPALIYHTITDPTRKKVIKDRSPIVRRFTEAQLFEQNLPVLEGLMYEVFITDDSNQHFSLSKFRVDESGELKDIFGKTIVNNIFPIPAEIDSISSAALHLEDGTVDGVNIPFLSGAIKNDRIFLTYQNIKIEDISGQYMLGTPTDNNTFLNERSGLWFGNVLTGVESLNLPPLPSGWVYEGWAVIDGQTITTGRFSYPNVADTFSGFSDNKALSPSFPGEDFLKNPPKSVFPNLEYPVDLSGQEIKITIEPDVKGKDPSGAAPFPVVIMQAKVSNRVESYRLYDLDLVNNSQLPKSTLVFR